MPNKSKKKQKLLFQKKKEENNNNNRWNPPCNFQKKKIPLHFSQTYTLFSLFPFFVSHVPSLRYVLIKVLLDFREL